MSRLGKGSENGRQRWQWGARRALLLLPRHTGGQRHERAVGVGVAGGLRRAQHNLDTRRREVTLKRALCCT